MRILITESKRFSQRAVSLLRKSGHEVVLGEEDYNSLLDKIYDYEGIIVRLGINIDEKLIRQGKRLKFIATSTTGLDHIVLEEAEKRGIDVISLKGETMFLEKITPTAELAVGLMLSALRNIVPAAKSVNEGGWDRDKWIGRTMQGKTVGIIGMGRLGKITTRLVKTFGCDVLYYDPFVFGKEGEKVNNLNELAERADIVSIHANLNKETEGMIDKEFFDRSKEGQIIINTSRGAVVDERALCEALKRGKIAGAGLDVLAGEREDNINGSELVKYARDHSNLVITPHIGGATSEAMRLTERFVAEKVVSACRESA